MHIKLEGKMHELPLERKQKKGGLFVDLRKFNNKNKRDNIKIFLKLKWVQICRSKKDSAKIYIKTIETT